MSNAVTGRRPFGGAVEHATSVRADTGARMAGRMEHLSKLPEGISGKNRNGAALLLS